MALQLQEPNCHPSGTPHISASIQQLLCREWNLKTCITGVAPTDKFEEPGVRT